MNRKGQTNYSVIIGIAILIVAIVVALVLYFHLNLTQVANYQVCHTSVVVKATGKGLVGNLQCKTDSVCISGGGKCANMNPSVTITVDPKNKDQILKAIADQMAQCWWTFGEGKLDYVGVTQGSKGGAQCAMCSIIGFDSSVQQALSAISAPASAQQFISAAQWVSNYNKYASLFDTYSKDYPKEISQVYFKAILVSIAYENNWGSNGDWLMGYHVGDGSYKTPEEQVKEVSAILKSAFDKTGGSLGYQTGTTDQYSKCTSSNFEDQAKCILSVYHTGKVPTGWFAHTFLPFGWGHNTAGDNYASEVMIDWNVLVNYFNPPVSNQITSSPYYPLTYKELFDYLAANKVTEDNQVQSYLYYLYGTSTMAQLLTVSQDKSTVQKFYDSMPIYTNGTYAVITGEGKGAFWGTFGTNYLRPVLLNTNDVSNYLGSYCSSYVTTSS